MASLHAEAGVVWAKPVFAIGEILLARIVAFDRYGIQPARIIWSLYRNGYEVFSGEGSVFKYSTPQIGLYRLKGTAYYNADDPSTFDSTAFVHGSVNVQHALPVPEQAGTMVYLGAVFTQDIAAAGGTAPTTPYKLASSTEDIALLPGTTHWTFDLDPDGTAVDDEVVVRTQKGNWCLNGLGGGLSGENIGYDYGYMPTFIPAPADRRVNLTAEMFKVNGTTFSGFHSRVRIKCYRNLPGGVYRYERCANSNHPGGRGRRARRWAALFTNAEVQTNLFNQSPLPNQTVAYKTVDVTSVPLMRMSTTGAPNPVPGYSGLFYTDSNLYAYYESDGSPDLASHAISAIEGVRPCCISFLLFNNSKPVICNRVKRVSGKMTVFLTDGAVIQGSTLTVRVYRRDGLTYSEYAVPINSTYYVNEEDTIQKVSEIDIDLSDYQFGETGVVVDFTVNLPADFGAWELEDLDGLWELEDGSGVWLLEEFTGTNPPDILPTPVSGPDYIYSAVYTHSVSYDGACYTNPTFQPVFDDIAVIVDLIGGCQDPVCGPNALYCYTALDAPAENVILPQPFGRPAPYVAYGSYPSRCFYNPAPLVEINGTAISTSEYTGSQAVDLWSYSGTSLCGAAYAYTDCQAAYAPCAAYTCSIIVVYPVGASPHTNISWGGNCYSFNGSTVDYGTRAVVAVADVDPVADCHDPDCVQFNASGSVVVYNDTQTLLEVPVRFDHIDRGIPQYGAALEVQDEGLTGLLPGARHVTFRQSADALVLTASATGHMIFSFPQLSGVKKSLIIVRGGVTTGYAPGIGATRATLSLQSGDQVYLRIADAYGNLPRFWVDKSVNMSWHPAIYLPRLYDTQVLPFAGTSSINAVGFCSYTNEGVYSFYGSMPFSGSMSGPVNPDSVVTVTGQDGQEYNLISMRAIGDGSNYAVSAPWYDGRALVGPFTFKFYAARDLAGFHGEMDVWLNTDGTFPGYLRAGRYDALALVGSNTYRKDSTPFDTTRNAYSVASASVVSEAFWPNLFTADSDGQVISVASGTGTLAVDSKMFMKQSADPGLSYVILDA